MTFLAIIAFLFLSGCLLRLLYRAETTHDELHFAETAHGATSGASDGVRRRLCLALYRYLPKGENPKPAPVILCHGFTSNRFTWDLPGVSLARWLAARGHDVWALELRGGGRSKRLASGRRVSRNYNFDDHVERDAPAAIDYVLKTTGAARADWVGHSMGGILLYAYLTRFGGEKIRRGCAIGSPGTMSGANAIFKCVTAIIPPPRYWPVIHSAFFLNFVLIFIRLGLVRDSAAAHVRNIGARRATAMAVNMHENITTKLTLHLSYMVRKDNIRQFPPGTFSYTDNLGKIETPLLLLAGGRDHLVPPPLVKYVFDHVASAEKRFVVYSRENGHSADYGHTDLVVGARAPDEIWPDIAEWLE